MMHLLLGVVVCFSVATVSNGQTGQLAKVAYRLTRILHEGLAVDPVTTTDVYFLNFVQPEYVELQAAVIAGLRKTNFTVTVFINARNEFARNRLFLMIAAPTLDKFKNCLNTILRPTLTKQQLAENSENIHVIVIVFNFNPSTFPFMELMTTTLSWFQSHQFIVVRSNPFDYRISTAARNLNVYTLRWNAPFEDLFYNRPFSGFDTPQYFAALRIQPRVVEKRGRLEGIDVIVFNAIMKHLNFTYRIILVNRGHGAERKAQIERLFNDLIVVGMVNQGAHLIEPTILLTLPHQDGLCILTPKSQRKHLFYHLLQPLDLPSWLLLCALLTIGAFVSSQCSKWFHQNLILSLFCGSTIQGHQMQRLERFTILGGTFLFTVLIEAYLAKFIFHMTTCQFERDPQTIDEFVESPHMLKGPQETVRFITNIRSSLKNKFIPVPEYNNIIDVIADTKYGYFLPCSVAETLLRERAIYDRLTYGTNVRPPFHLIPEKLDTHHLVYHFSPYFFSFARFKRSLDILFEAGFTDYWEKDSEQEYYVSPAFEFTDTVVLDMERLQLLWVVYGIGIVVSILGFICELILRRISPNH